VRQSSPNNQTDAPNNLDGTTTGGVLDCVREHLEAWCVCNDEVTLVLEPLNAIEEP
jgi:hypothetical protein